MNQLGPFVVLIGVAAVLLATLGGVVAWWNAEERRIRRGLAKVLDEAPHAMITAPGRGRGAGFNFATNTMAVTWDSGGWCLIYRIDELTGVELILDGQVAARSWRGEPRRPLDLIGGAERQVVLRLVFDDPHHPDFTLELWSQADVGRPKAVSCADAVEEGNRWIARTESVFRRQPAAVPLRPKVAPAAAPAPAPEATPAAAVQREAEPAPAPRAAPLRQELPFDDEAPHVDEAPWDEAPWDEAPWNEADDKARM